MFYIFCCCFSVNPCSRFTYSPFVLIICIVCYKCMNRMHRTVRLSMCPICGVLMIICVIAFLSSHFLEVSCSWCLLLGVLLAHRSFLQLFFTVIILDTLPFAYDVDYILHLTGSFLDILQLSLLF